MASEALLDRIPQVGLEKVLTEGNNRSSRFTQTQADQFIADGWTVVEHRRNTATGFSGTLFKYTGETDQSKELIKNQLVLSFRSTEFIDDAARDNKATNELEIKETGFAWGQIADMQQWYAELKEDGTKLGAGQAFSVTGYSLGGHLATVFNLLNAGAALRMNVVNGVRLLSSFFCRSAIKRKANNPCQSSARVDFFLNISVAKVGALHAQ